VAEWEWTWWKGATRVETALTVRNSGGEVAQGITGITGITVLGAIRPFQADDGHKGTFLVLRIGGMEQGMALRIVNRKFRSWQHWRATDEDFRELDDRVPELAARFGGEARVIRTALLDISIIEAGIGIFQKILKKEPVSDPMWTYVTKLAGLRVPVMGAREESGSPWERLANSIRNTMNQTQRELTVREMGMDGSERSITAREVEVKMEPSPEQRQVAQDIVKEVLARVGAD